MHAASGSLSWAMELLAFASRQFAPKIVDLSVCFINSHFVRFFLVSDRSGRRKPPADRSALYVHMQCGLDNENTAVFILYSVYQVLDNENRAVFYHKIRSTWYVWCQVPGMIYERKGRRQGMQSKKSSLSCYTLCFVFTMKIQTTGTRYLPVLASLVV